jgi:hypothetical protein
MTGELTTKEQEIKKIMEEVFVPVLHDILSKANPKEYEKWQGNACRQTALFSAKLLQEFLPEYQWSVWDGNFNDLILGQQRHFDHAWVYGVNRSEGRRLLVDLARVHQERLFVITGGNHYPKDHPEYVHLTELSRRKINIDEMMGIEEHYTQMNSNDLLKLIQTKMVERFT